VHLSANAACYSLVADTWGVALWSGVMLESMLLLASLNRSGTKRCTPSRAMIASTDRLTRLSRRSELDGPSSEQHPRQPHRRTRS
jgi:hypothetical protein